MCITAKERKIQLDTDNNIIRREEEGCLRNVNIYRKGGEEEEIQNYEKVHNVVYVQPLRYFPNF